MNLKTIIGSVAPTLATALGGPVAGAAMSSLATLFGCEKDEEAIFKAFTAADPSKLSELKKLDYDFKVEMKKLDIDVYKIDADDRANAREREIKTGDKTQTILAYMITFGYFSVLAFIIKFGLPESNNEALLILLGALSGAWGSSIVTYYFGSSKSSSDKNSLFFKK